MSALTFFARDRLGADERFRRMLSALSAQDGHTIQALSEQTPRVTWEAPDPTFTERLRVAEMLVRTMATDLNVIITKLTMLTAFETTLRDFDEVVQNEMGLAWMLGWEAAGGHSGEPLAPHQDKLRRLQAACRIPETFTASIEDLRNSLATYWSAWSTFTRTQWHIKPDVPLKAFVAATTPAILAAIRNHTGTANSAQADTYRRLYDEAWQTTLQGMGG